MNLNFVPPVTESIAKFDEEGGWKLGVNLWNFALIGHVIGLTV